jgi:hypothetical protein
VKQAKNILRHRSRQELLFKKHRPEKKERRRIASQSVVVSFPLFSLGENLPKAVNLVFHINAF